MYVIPLPFAAVEPYDEECGPWIAHDPRGQQPGLSLQRALQDQKAVRDGVGWAGRV